MKKLILAFALICVLPASSLPTWGNDHLIYVCYLEKEQQVRIVDTTSNCKRPEMAIALNQTEPGTTADQDISKRAQAVARKYPDWPGSSMFGNSDSFVGRYGSSSNR